MSTLSEKLIRELRDRHPLRCGAVDYPLSWMTKTRERLERDGTLKRHICDSCRSHWLLAGWVRLELPSAPQQEHSKENAK